MADDKNTVSGTRRGRRGGQSEQSRDFTPADLAAYQYPSDDMIERDRKGRWVVFIVLAILIFLVTTWVTLTIFSKLGFPMFGWAIAFTASYYFILKLYEGSLISNGSDQGFITVNRLQTLTAKKRGEISSDEAVEQAKRFGRQAYGPGDHISYPWEGRDSSNNVTLTEVPEDFSFRVQIEGGTITGKGSFRIRPDIRDLVGFQLSAGAISSNLIDLIKERTIAYLVDPNNDVKAAEVSKAVPGLNESFKRSFGSIGQRDTDFEERFRVFIGDITVGELLASEEVLKVLNAQSEAAGLALGAAKYLGYKNVTGVRTAIKNGTITKADWDKAQKAMLQISGQDNMQTTRQLVEIDLSGVDPAVIDGLAHIAKVAAPAVSALAKRGQKSPGRGKPKNSGDSK